MSDFASQTQWQPAYTLWFSGLCVHLVRCTERMTAQLQYMHTKHPRFIWCCCILKKSCNLCAVPRLHSGKHFSHIQEYVWKLYYCNCSNWMSRIFYKYISTHQKDQHYPAVGVWCDCLSQHCCNFIRILSRFYLNQQFRCFSPFNFVIQCHLDNDLLNIENKHDQNLNPKKS